MPSETLDLLERNEGGDRKSEIRRTKEAGADGTIGKTGTPCAMATLVLHEKGSKAE